MNENHATVTPPAERARKSARISPDRRWVGITAIILVMLIMTASHVFSYAMIADAAIWSGMPDNADWVRFLAPIYIDGAIITYTLAFSIFHWRAERGNALQARRWLRFFTGLSMVINGAHSAGHWGWDTSLYEMWAGVAISIMAPFAALAAAEQVVKLSFERAPETSTKPFTNTGVVEPESEPAQSNREAPVTLDEEPSTHDTTTTENPAQSATIPNYWSLPPIVNVREPFHTAPETGVQQPSATPEPGVLENTRTAQPEVPIEPIPGNAVTFLPPPGTPIANDIVPGEPSNEAAS